MIYVATCLTESLDDTRMQSQYPVLARACRFAEERPLVEDNTVRTFVPQKNAPSLLHTRGTKLRSGRYFGALALPSDGRTP